MRGQLTERLMALAAQPPLSRPGQALYLRVLSGDGQGARGIVSCPPHSHRFPQVICPCRGTARHWVNGGPEIELQAGELLLVRRQASHREELEGSGLETCFTLGPRFFSFGKTMAAGSLAAGFLMKLLCQTGEPDCLVFRTSQQPQVQNAWETLLLDRAFPGKTQENTEQAAMGLLLLHLADELSLADREHAGRGWAVLLALEEIDRHYPAADLTRLAGELGMSLSYLSSAIHSATGKTFKELLLEKRLEKARQLLKGPAPVEEIIAAVGYDNTSYFYRKFRQRFGLSPREYRLGRKR